MSNSERNYFPKNEKGKNTLKNKNPKFEKRNSLHEHRMENNKKYMEYRENNGLTKTKKKR